MTNTAHSIPKKTAMIRGVKGVCPNCAKAPLFKSYLKAVEGCGSCDMKWSTVRADDGPAWATMLIVGHLLAPVLHYLIFKPSLPVWAPMTILMGLALGLSLIILPRMKGLFIALIWVTKAPTS